MGNRKFVYIPQINPNTFLFFYHEGSSGKSFSFREYPAQGKPKTTYAKAYPSFSADQILKLAEHVFDAPTHPTTDNEYWYSKIKELNERYLSHEKPSADTAFKRISIPIKPVPKNGHETAFCIKGQGDQVISSVTDWHLYAPPKNPVIQWQDGKSAKELARAWFRGGKLDMPKDFRWLLKSHSVTSNFEPYEGFAEHKTPIDNFGEGNEFCKKITYKATKEKPEDLITSFRNSYYPRIAVTVDMISTGTDIRPLECLVFMRNINSRVYFEQMKGRGTRTISKTDLEAVTPDNDTKTHFVIVDAVGVCENDKTDSRPLEKKEDGALRQAGSGHCQGETRSGHPLLPCRETC